jgi:hypothetical protein
MLPQGPNSLRCIDVADYLGDNMNRRAAMIAMSVTVIGCASKEFKPLEFAPPIALQDPLPGLAIIYLLRAPHDPVAVDVALNSTLVARLPAGTYTAVNLRPGAYAIATREHSSVTTTDGVDNPVLTVSAGERRFLYTSVPTQSKDSIGMAFVGKSGIIPLLAPVTTRVGQRTWHECSELDAQGLMSIGRVITPDRQSL